MKPFFEWWQTSIVQRLPKARGFTRYYKLVKDVVIVNLGVLDADIRIADAMEITKQLLHDLGYIKSTSAFVKILWHGDYAKHLTFKDIDTFSASAKTKIATPGTVHSVPKKTPEKAVKSKGKSTLKKEPAKAKKVIVEAKKIVAPVKAKPAQLIESPMEKKIAEPVVKKAVAAVKPAAKKAIKEDKPAPKKPAAKPAAAKKPTTKKTK